jgi:hypothetical protein
MEKRILNYVEFIGGIFLLLLGLLWFLQGSDLVHIKPILCFANCTPITGKSMMWQIVGGAVFIAGVTIIYKYLKK